MNRFRFLSLLLVIFIMSCDSGNLWRDGQYVVSWIDTSDNRALRLMLKNGDTIARVGKTVVSVGSNNEYIVAIQNNDQVNKYFIVLREKDKLNAKLRDVVLGPLTKQEYDRLKSTMKLPVFSQSWE